MTVKAAVLTGYGINADYELAEAYRIAGAEAVRIHINDLISEPVLLDDFHILNFPGGFSFGDHISSGLVFANFCKKHLYDPINRFRDQGKLVIGICNGFQVLVKMGFLPNLSGDWKQEVSLIHNDSGKFIDEWVTVQKDPRCTTPWLDGVETIDLPIRHGEGRFFPRNSEVLKKIKNQGMAAIRYVTNPNGSVDDIAGITDSTGRIFGLMPHPEAFLIPENHPYPKKSGNVPLGVVFFKNGVRYIKKNLII